MLSYYLMLASGLLSTIYGFGEWNCGDVGSPKPCAEGAITASGEDFNPQLPQVAIAAPFNMRLKAMPIWLRVEGGLCYKVQLVDKLNERYVGIRGFDLTPAAVALLTGKDATEYWSGVVHVCDIRPWQEVFSPKQPLRNVDVSRILSMD